MKYSLSFCVAILLSGCGFESTKTDSTTTTTATAIYFGGLYNEQWYMEKDSDFYTKNGINSEAHIHPDTTTYQTYTGKGVKVAIIDDGFDVNHPEIKDQIIVTKSVSTLGTITSDVAQIEVTDHHGTAVTGIIASKNNSIGIRGIAPDSSLILIRMPEFFSDSTIIKMFEEAINAGADVINCSWGTGNVSQAVRDYINDITRTARNGKGVVVIFAAGNDNIDIGNDEASIENVIAVGATDGDNLRTTSYSNYGAALDIVAPGGYYDSIATIDPLGSYGVSSDEYNRYNQVESEKYIGFIGTSASAPIMTGVVALLLEKNPNLTAQEIQEKLKTATDIIGQNTPYIYDMVSSNSQTPIIRGIYGTSQLGTFKVKLTSNTSSISCGPYSVVAETNNSWSSHVVNTLPNGDYTIELVDNDGETIWATDESFIIDTSFSTATINSSIKRNNYYGYGKINLSKLLE